MITGTKHWNDRDVFYSQTNNPTEAFLKAAIATDARRGWLESCGPTAAVNCLAAMGAELKINCPGEYSPQPEEVLMDFFNDPRNEKDLKAIRAVVDDIPENRVPQYYPYAVRQVFGRGGSTFAWLLSFDDIAKYLMGGSAVQLCLRIPGHYIAAIAFDGATKEIIYNDSWGERFTDKKGGWHRRMDMTEFKSNVKSFFIIYS